MRRSKIRSLLFIAGCLAASLFGAGALAQPVDSPVYAFGPFVPPGFPGAPSTIFGTQTLILHTTDNADYALPATVTGAYYSSNNGEGPVSSAYHYAQNKNYIAASCEYYGCDTLLGPEENAHNFFVFDLSGVSGQIDSATLSIGNGPNGSSLYPAHYTVWDVTTSTSVLEASHSFDGAGLAIYEDLGSGIPYGGVTVGPGPADDGSQVLIQLQPLAFDTLDAAEGGSWAVGGALVPEPASWAMMLVGFCGLGAAMRLHRQQLAATA